MNFSVHFDEATIDRLSKAVDQQGLTRNRIIVKAVQEWLERNEARDWPEALKEHFRNPAPELSAEADADVKAWRTEGAVAGARW
jgi:predicted transcriptional regulator